MFGSSISMALLQALGLPQSGVGYSWPLDLGRPSGVAKAKRQAVKRKNRMRARRK